MILSILTGIIFGLLGFVPLLLCLRASRLVNLRSNVGYGAFLLIGVFASMLVMIMCVFIFYSFSKEYVVPMVLATGLTLSICAIVFGIYINSRREKAYKQRIMKTCKQKDV